MSKLGLGEHVLAFLESAANSGGMSSLCDRSALS